VLHNEGAENTDEALLAHIESIIQKLLSPRCAALVRIEKASTKNYGAS